MGAKARRIAANIAKLPGLLRKVGLPLAPGSYFGRSVGVTGFLPGERSNALPCARNHDHHGNHNDLANRTRRHGRCRCWSGYGPCGCRSCRCCRGRGCWGCVWSAILGTANWPLLDRQQFPSPLLVSSASLTNDPVRRPRSHAADRGGHRQAARFGAVAIKRESIKSMSKPSFR